MNVDTNSTISVDCAVFGFDGLSLKVLLINMRDISARPRAGDSDLLESDTIEN